MRSVRDKIINAGNSAGNLSSILLDGAYVLSMSAQGVTTGDAIGTLKLQGSNDEAYPPPSTQAPTNWSDIPNATIAIAGAGVYLIPKTEVCYKWLRAVYVTTSGTGTLNVNVQMLGF